MQFEPPAEPPVPRPAATVILLRRGGRHTDRGLELLMLRRGAQARFMPGVWVFAGGVVEEADREQKPPADSGADADEWAHRVCGARELGEEGGIAIGPEVLAPWSRWITPEQVPLRFDTRFYVGLAPAHSKPEPDRSEMDEARWIGPQEALDAGARGELEISFPTDPSPRGADELCDRRRGRGRGRRSRRRADPAASGGHTRGLPDRAAG